MLYIVLRVLVSRHWGSLKAGMGFDMQPQIYFNEAICPFGGKDSFWQIGTDFTSS